MTDGPVEEFEVWQAWSGPHQEEGCGYDSMLFYDDWTDLMADVRTALTNGRDVLICRELLTLAQWDAMIWASDELNDESVKRFRGEA